MRFYENERVYHFVKELGLQDNIVEIKKGCEHTSITFGEFDSLRLKQIYTCGIKYRRMASSENWTVKDSSGINRPLYEWNFNQLPPTIWITP